jgi:hypothetical protein
VTDGRPRARFSGLLLQSAQSNSDGTLIVAIGEYGRAVLVVANDGRILVRHALEHEHATISLDGAGAGSFGAPPASAWWTADSTAFASSARSVVVWRAKHPFSSERVAQVMRKRVPWRIESGQLIPAGRISGRVLRDSAPAPGVSIEIVGRHPAGVSDKPVSFDSMKAQLVSRTTTTDHDGRFVVDQLELGELEYRVSARDGERRGERQVTASRDGDEPIGLHLR